jgi:signal transduction histidine kinase
LGGGASRAVVFLVFPLLIWAAVRFGQRGATAAVAFVSATAVAWTAAGYGPFSHGRLQEGLWTMQAYMAVMVITLLVLGAITEERARALDALRKALDAREEFLSIASHELKTPLSAIVLNLTGLQRALRRGEPLTQDGMGRKVDRAVKQTDRLTGLIGTLLDVSRISSGRLELSREQLDLSELARDVSGRFAEEAARTGATLTVSGAQSVAGKWDRVRLEQVLSNLFSNAIRYGNGSRVDIRLEESDGRAMIAVEDRGRGIAADALGQVFERFGSSKAARRHGGMGLGLYISRQIVEAHGGTIRVTSEVGKGSTFTVELPLRAEPTASDQDKSSSAGDEQFERDDGSPDRRAPGSAHYEGR